MPLNYPNVVADQTIFNETINKIVGSIHRTKAEQELVKTLCGDLKDAYGAEPASVRKLAKLLADKSTDGLMEEVEELVTTFEKINGGADV